MEYKNNHPEIRKAVAEICAKYPSAYWQELDAKRAYPTEFVQSLTELGFLSTLIPETYGGDGNGVMTEAAVILEEIHRAGCNAAACHAQMYTMSTILRHGSEEQKQKYLPGIAAGKLRLQAFGVTEPTSGTDTTRILTEAVREGDHYVVNGQKVFISRAEHSDLMILLVRTTPRDQVKKRSDGITVLLVDMKEAIGNGLTIRPIRTMMNHATTELFIDNLKVPIENRIGEEGKGFKYILSGFNAERILLGAECIGDARWFIKNATQYAKKREVFGRPIGQNQGVQFPIAEAYIHTEAAALMVYQAAEMYDAGQPCGAEANMAKMLAADASWEAADMCLQTYGGYGFAEEYDIERKFRETRLYRVAPISTNLILSFIGTNILGLPKSF